MSHLTQFCFSDGDIVVQVDVSNPVHTTIQTGLDTDVVIGGLRLLSLALDTPQTGDLGRATVDTTTDTLRIETNEGFERYGVSWATTDTTTALNIDLVADGSDAFRIDVTAVSTVFASDVTIRLILRSGLDEGVTQTNTSVVRLPPSLFPYAVRVPFSRFPDVDFTDIDFIGFDDSRGPFSLTLDAIRTVPEPAGIRTLFIGLVFGLVPLARGRKRIKGAAVRSCCVSQRRWQTTSYERPGNLSGCAPRSSKVAWRGGFQSGHADGSVARRSAT